MLKEHPFYKTVSSLKLTTLLLCLSMLLIFFGTLDQAQYGIRQVQELYFKGFITIWKYPETWYLGDKLSWLGLPIPGGFLIGPLLILNLVTAHFRYFHFSARKAGLICIHAGILTLLLGQGIADLFQEDYYLWLDKGESSNYSQSFHQDELVIIETTHPEHNTVVSIPAQLLKKQRFLHHDALPFQLRVLAYYPNSIVRKQSGVVANQGLTPTPTKGVGAEMNLVAEPIAPTRKDDERNLPSLLLAIDTPEGTLGTWLLNTAFEGRVPDPLIEFEGRSFQIALRIKRNYFPFTVTLGDFEHLKYPGSDIPRAFTSWVTVTRESNGETRDAKISMNHPLRYEGYTFYQASFGKQGNASMFQIVRNPGWLLPYFALLMVTIGLLYQFSIQLYRFLKRRFAE